MDTKRWAEPKLIVEPTYPAAELAAGITGIVDIDAHIPLSGRIFKINSMTSEPKSPALEKAVSDVLKYWTFYEETGCDCVPVAADLKLRIWFEIRDGKPIVSVSSPPRKSGPDSARPRLLNREALSKTMASGYPREARRASAQADVHAAIHVDPVTGKTRDVEIKLIWGSSKQVFGVAAREGLATAEFSVEGMAQDAKPVACMSVRYRLSSKGPD